MVDLNDFIEVTLNHQDDFLKVRETLTRIGVSSRKEKILYQFRYMAVSLLDMRAKGKDYSSCLKEIWNKR